ncbi:unnamed protein product [Calypogeia fissa]
MAFASSLALPPARSSSGFGLQQRPDSRAGVNEQSGAAAYVFGVSPTASVATFARLRNVWQPSGLVSQQWSRKARTFGLNNNTSSFSQNAGVGRRQRLGLWRAELKPDSGLEDPLFPSSLSNTPSGRLNASLGDAPPMVSEDESNGLVGEDAAVFNVEEQQTSSWVYFSLVLGVVLAILYVTWLDPNTGYGGAFINALTSLNSSHEVVMMEILLIFALVHSGGAGFRVTGEKLIGERAYRVLFAGASLPLAVSAVVYFINHRYDGYQLWQFRTVPGVHEFCWALSFVSFLFLYPSTFNLLEVAAVDKPKVHMWETGIMRITRHPQMVGQVLWCIAHTLWIGNSFTLITSLGLTAHHLFGVWHGDRRLSAKYGEAFEVVKNRTSVLPFAAILEGRQKLPPDYYKEFLRLPYYVIVGMTIGAYVSHPLLQSASHWLHW